MKKFSPKQTDLLKKASSGHVNAIAVDKRTLNSLLKKGLVDQDYFGKITLTSEGKAVLSVVEEKEAVDKPEVVETQEPTPGPWEVRGTVNDYSSDPETAIIHQIYRAIDVTKKEGWGNTEAYWTDKESSWYSREEAQAVCDRLNGITDNSETQEADEVESKTEETQEPTPGPWEMKAKYISGGTGRSTDFEYQIYRIIDKTKQPWKENIEYYNSKWYSCSEAKRICDKLNGIVDIQPVKQAEPNPLPSTGNPLQSLIDGLKTHELEEQGLPPILRLKGLVQAIIDTLIAKETRGMDDMLSDCLLLLLSVYKSSGCTPDRIITLAQDRLKGLSISPQKIAIDEEDYVAHARKNSNYTFDHGNLLVEYYEKVEQGEFRPLKRIERLEKIAIFGSPERQQVRSALRLLERHRQSNK